MKGDHIKVNNEIELVPPDIERDPQISLSWLQSNGASGLMRLMNVELGDNYQPNIDDEINRIQFFIDRPDQVVWMIKYNETIVGSIWSDMETDDHLEAPVACLMIGDKNVRSHGLGELTTRSVLGWLSSLGYQRAYARAVLVANTQATSMLKRIGYVEFGEPRSNSRGDVLQDFKVELPVD